MALIQNLKGVLTKMDVSLAVRLMLYGLTGVFTVLIVFYAILRLLPIVLPERGARQGGPPPAAGASAEKAGE